MVRYPKELFSIREDVTAEAIREHERKVARVYAKCEEICKAKDKDFWELSFRERMEMKKKVREELYG